MSESKAIEVAQDPVREGVPGLLSARISLFFSLCLLAGIPLLWSAYSNVGEAEDVKFFATVAIVGGFIGAAVFAAASLNKRRIDFGSLRSLRICIVMAMLLVGAMIVLFIAAMYGVGGGISSAIILIFLILELLLFAAMIKSNYDQTRLPSLTASLSIIETALFFVIAIISFYLTSKRMDKR